MLGGLLLGLGSTVGFLVTGLFGLLAGVVGSIL